MYGLRPAAACPRHRRPARRACRRATVDRVLNRRAGVRDVTVQRVLEAARYWPARDGPFAALAAKPLRLAFLLPAGTNRYLRMLGETVGYMEDQLAPLNMRCRATIEGFDPRVLAERHAAARPAATAWR